MAATVDEIVFLNVFRYRGDEPQREENTNLWIPEDSRVAGFYAQKSKQFARKSLQNVSDFYEELAEGLISHRFQKTLEQNSLALPWQMRTEKGADCMKKSLILLKGLKQVDLGRVSQLASRQIAIDGMSLEQLAFAYYEDGNQCVVKFRGKASSRFRPSRIYGDRGGTSLSEELPMSFFFPSSNARNVRVEYPSTSQLEAKLAQVITSSIAWKIDRASENAANSERIRQNLSVK